jgi:inositol phosphorylceramide mannosyltransferase catalytic subunit
MILVPRTIHQIWLGPSPLPKEFATYRKTWKKHHPDWEMPLWTEDNLPEGLRRTEVYETLRVPAERADILRLEVLFMQGGVYVDTDFECRRSLEPFIEELDFFTGYLKPGRVNTAFIGAVPGHMILERALDELRPVKFHGYDKNAAGPLFLNELIKDYPEVRVFEPRLFYPSTPEERDSAVAVHHAARSWKDAEGFRESTRLAESRLAKVQAALEEEQRRHQATRAELTRALGRDASSAGIINRLRGVLGGSR